MKVAGFDVGTTGLKGVIVDSDGSIVAETTIPYAPSVPRPGWSQQDPEVWWAAFIACAAALVQKAGAPDAIGLSGQMHGSVFLDAAAKSISPAILWNDQRTEAECAQLIEMTGNKAVDWTLNEPRTAFTAAKILWLRNNYPEIYARLHSVLLPKDFLRFRMSGERLSDVTDSSGTNLLDVRNREWSQPMLTATGIERSLLPDLVESVDRAGAVTRIVAERTGLNAGTPIVGGGADQACAAIGNGIVESGTLSITIGTSGVVYVQLPEIALDRTGAFHTFCHAVPGTFMAMAGVLAAGGSFQWYHDTIGASDAEKGGFSGIVQSLDTLPPGAGGLVFLPYLTGERSPHNDPRARGAFIGLSNRHTRAHMARAVIEGVCFALRDLVEIIEGMNVSVSGVRVAGGGARGRIWLTTLASVLGRPVMATETPDASAFGAAMLAMSHRTDIAIGDLATSWVKTAPPVEPEMTAQAIYQDLYQVFRSLYPANRSAMHALFEIDSRTSQDVVQ
ncbi:xylulokinase [Pelagibacterium lentulum]|uniref:Xylulose kinase n=1 Tax=Pelagibacterium lentulum TaxID=2029865 RepID=A0A916VXE0_9HYPH|nr:xylulokinase [Pelagibacterium lentulum]GGA48297.1 xylulokinase [Pelagibacterium lentulum]